MTHRAEGLVSGLKSERVLHFLEWAVPVFLAGRMISHWISEFGLLPDSTFYLCAAGKFLETGRFVVHTNFPSFDFAPTMEVYSEYPPGFPLYLAPFLFVLGDPLLAAAVAQSAAVFGLFALSVPLFRLLQWPWIIRLAGYAFLGFFVSFREIFQFLFSEPLFLLVMTAASCQAIRLLRASTASRSDWFWGGVLLFIGTSIKFIGVFNLALFLPALFLAPKNRGLKFLGLAAATVAPAVLWLGRNQILFGKLSRSHLEEWSQDPRNFVDPFLRVKSVLAFNTLSMAMLLAVVLILPFILHFFLRRGDGPRTFLAGHATLVLGAVSHLLGIAFLSALFRMDFPDHRLLSPSYQAIGFALLSGVAFVSTAIPQFGRLALLAPFLYMGVNPSFQNPLPPFYLGPFQRPPEERLWKEIVRIEDLQGSSHFYTDINFLHQIFCDRPHKIVWNPNYADDPEKTGWLLQYGERPFFVVKETDPLAPLLRDQAGTVGLVEREIEDFRVFFSPKPGLSAAGAAFPSSLPAEADSAGDSPEPGEDPPANP